MHRRGAHWTFAHHRELKNAAQHRLGLTGHGCAARIERSAASIRAGDASPTRWDRNRISYGDRDCLFDLKTTSALLDIANAWFDRSTKHTSMPARA